MATSQLEAAVRIGAPEAEIPATIAGHNLETTEKNVLGMLSNRLENAKFAGPADVNGFPSPWRSSLDFFQAVRAQVDDNVSLAGAGSAQMMLAYSGVEGDISQALLQTLRPVRAGERLEAVIWAKVRHEPARLKVALRPNDLPAREYSSGEILVDAPFWKRHVVALDAPADDEKAVFAISVVGAGLVWLDQIQLRPAGEGHVSEAMAERLERFRVPVLRFPGGCVTTNYRWRHGTGPVERRPALLDTINRRLQNYDFGTDEYLELCHAQGITPHITVNVGTGTPEEAAEWAAYVADFFRARGEEPPVAYFQVGNEDWGIHEHSHMTAEMYGDVLRAYVPGIRAAYPAARIVAVAEKHGMTLTQKGTPWRAVVLPVAKELGIEVLVVHIYVLAKRDDEVEQHAHAIGAVAEARAGLDELLADVRAAGLDSAIGVTEWNYWTSASHWDGPRTYERSGATMAERYGASHAMFGAGLLHAFAQLAPDLELANFYHLVNGMGVFEHRGIDVHDGPMAALFDLYRPAWPGRRLALSLQDAGEAGRFGGAPAVDALAVGNDDGRWVFVVNRHPSEGARVRVAGEGGPLSEPEAIDAVAAPRPSAPLVAAAAGAVAWDDGAVTLPPLSIARLRWAVAS